MDKERFVIVSTFKRLKYLCWGRAEIHCHHRNLANIFEENGEPTSEAMKQRIQGWRVFLGHFRILSCTSLTTITARGTCCPVNRREVGLACTRTSSKERCFSLRGNISDERYCSRRACGRCVRWAHPRYGVGGVFEVIRRAVPGGGRPCSLLVSS